MSLESFSSFDASEGMSEAAFEAFKEKMKRAAAQIAAIKKEEKKQKQKEDELFKILLRFIKSSKNKELVLLISRVLEKNIPSSFILSMIWLGDTELMEQLENLKVLNAGDSKVNEKSIVFFKEERTFSLENRIELDRWIKGILEQAGERPEKLLKTAYEYKDEKKIISPALINLFAYLMKNYFNQNKIEFSTERIDSFTSLVLKNILDRTKHDYENRAKLN